MDLFDWWCLGVKSGVVILKVVGVHCSGSCKWSSHERRSRRYTLKMVTTCLKLKVINNPWCSLHCAVTFTACKHLQRASQWPAESLIAHHMMIKVKNSFRSWNCKEKMNSKQDLIFFCRLFWLLPHQSAKKRWTANEIFDFLLSPLLAASTPS